MKIQNLDMYNLLTMQFYVQLAIGAVLLSLFFIIVRKKSDIKINNKTHRSPEPYGSITIWIKLYEYYKYYYNKYAHRI